MSQLTANEISNLGYWDRFCELRGYSVYAMNEGQIPGDEEFEFTREEMEMLRGTRPMPSNAATELPELRFRTGGFDGGDILNEHGSVVATEVRESLGPLLADALKMLKALRVIHADGNLAAHAEHIETMTRDDLGPYGDHGRRRVKEIREAIAIIEEVVKRHADL